jgi:hypothetical protein
LGGGEKIKFQKKKLRSGLIRANKKSQTWDGAGIEKRILSVHHPSTLVHWWVLVHYGRETVSDLINHRTLQLTACG